MDAEDAEDDIAQPDALDTSHDAILEERTEELKEAKPSIPFMPTSVKRGKANVSVEEYYPRQVSSSAPAVDFFSLGMLVGSLTVCMCI